MAPSPSPEPLDRADLDALFEIAESTITDALAGVTVVLPEPGELSPVLQASTGTFVTLTVDSELNGCIGTIEGAGEPLGHAVARLAFQSAFADPRLPALERSEYSRLTIEISLLSPLSPIPVRSWQALVDELRPSHDGVVIRAQRRQGVFLPSVWDKLPDPAEFLDQLYLKAGLRPRSWPRDTEALRFTASHYERPTTKRHAA